MGRKQKVLFWTGAIANVDNMLFITEVVQGRRLYKGLWSSATYGTILIRSLRNSIIQVNVSLQSTCRAHKFSSEAKGQCY